ncbi:hypothetical protein [Bacillus sp. MRMR6]|uniref:hypothetical protein n=1 Tax=Bacillus sp. MRMR6 TaxID=1928617 RepID=UPI000951C2FF|nr:hypothetical protein [Bacillus sp. MRMR6]OLS40320.1 hypothetical protein BTR25_09130 [Bacillus sp. MRMR6]
MKILMVTGLLAVSLIFLIIALDLLMGTSLSEVFQKATNPFRVMEPGEYIVVILFTLSVVIRSYFSVLKKKNASASVEEDSDH